MEHEQRSDGYTAVEDRYAGYNVYDPSGERIGKVDDLFVDEYDSPEYIGVKMGFLGTRSTLLPYSLVRSTDDGDKRLEISADKESAKNGPAFDDDKEITPDFEREVHSYYGLESADATEERGAYGGYYADEGTTTGNGTAGAGMAMGDTESGEFREHDPADEGVLQSRGDDLADEDELRVQRSEEELRAGTREREAGSLRVRKRVRTDRETIEVPTRHEEVSVERVPASGEATEAQIGEEELTVPVTEEEVVVEKRPVVKEEVRVRKDVVEDTETVEEDVRREEVEVEDDTERGRGTGL
jgi:uncharacterized protein (TIGR02271 family)